MVRSDVDIAWRRDHVEVRGLSASDVEELLAVVEMIREMQADNNLSQAELAGLLTQSVELVQGVQAEHSAAIRDNLRQVLMSSGVSLNPPASLVQAQRLAAHRDALLSTPVFTHDTLSELRGDNTVSSTRTWLARRREDRSLFRTLIRVSGVGPKLALAILSGMDSEEFVRSFCRHCTTEGSKGGLCGRG